MACKDPCPWNMNVSGCLIFRGVDAAEARVPMGKIRVWGVARPQLPTGTVRPIVGWQKAAFQISGRRSSGIC